jgi:1-aminocyclopropane-1-carboxylate deaminase/D-cysteine desulfhydrase-like pyridoxal-dependent ACC family enzyme
MSFNIFNAPIEILHDELFYRKKITVSVVRLDKIHPIASGNKLFKLHYFLQSALISSHKTIVTFGGAYSNHLIATAFTCFENGIKCIGIARGEIPVQLSPTLQQCLNYGMQLKFISRELYNFKEEDSFISEISAEFGECIIIPEGGYHHWGARGAALITESIKENNYTHICTATGTATTVAGLLLNNSNQKIISVPVLKGIEDIEKRIIFLGAGAFNRQQLDIFDNYHFGGYAKKTVELINFMNYLWQQYQLPTDFVYTAKLFFAIFDKIKSDYFPKGSNILCLHTGGLQGNNSLPSGTLLF